MKRFSLLQLLAAPAIAGLLLLSPVGSAQAQSGSNNQWVQQVAGGALAGIAASSLFAWISLGFFYRAVPTVDKKIKEHTDKINRDIKLYHDELFKKVENSISDYTKEIKQHIKNPV